MVINRINWVKIICAKKWCVAELREALSPQRIISPMRFLMKYIFLVIILSMGINFKFIFPAFGSNLQEELQSKIEMLEQAIEKENQHITSLKEEFLQIQKERANIVNQLKKRDERIQQLSSQLKECEQKRESLSEEFITVNKSIQKLKQQLEDRERELKEITEEIDNEKKEFSYRLEETRQKVQALLKQEAVWSKEKEKLLKEIKKKEEKNKELQETIKRAIASIEKLAHTKLIPHD